MIDTHYLDGFFEHLPETDKREILTLANIRDDRPPWLRGLGGAYEPVRQWMGINRTKIADVIFRVVDPTDNEVSLLAGDVPLWVEAEPSSSGVTLKFEPFASQSHDPDLGGPGIFLTDLALAADLGMEFFASIRRANRPLGLVVDPPRVRIKSGSVDFTIGGGLLAGGLGLIVACGAGLIAAPVVGPAAGVFLAGAGLLDLAIGWKRTLAEAGKLDAERDKLRAETKQLGLTPQTSEGVEALPHPAKEVESLAPPAQPRESPNFAHSSLVPRSVVSREARRWQVSENYANHLLNRGLPILIEGRRYTNISLRSVALRASGRPRRKGVNGVDRG